MGRGGGGERGSPRRSKKKKTSQLGRFYPAVELGGKVAGAIVKRSGQEASVGKTHDGERNEGGESKLGTAASKVRTPGDGE